MNSFKELINDLTAYNDSLFSKIEDENIRLVLSKKINLIKKNKIDTEFSSIKNYFETLKQHKFNIVLLRKIADISFDQDIYDNKLSNTFLNSLTTSKAEITKKIDKLNKTLIQIEYLNKTEELDDTSIVSVNKIFLDSFINIELKIEDVNIIDIKNNTKNINSLHNLIIDEYVIFMNKAINKNEQLVSQIREDNINLLFNCPLFKTNIDINKDNKAIQTYNFIPIKYAESMDELFNIPSNLSKDNIAKILSKKYNTNICLIIDDIIGNDIEYRIPSGILNNININTEFINQSKTLIYKYYDSKKDVYKRVTNVYGKETDDTQYIYVRHCDSNNYALMNNKMYSSNFLLSKNSVHNLLNNNISNRIHCYYRDENINQEHIFDPDLIMNLNYNIKFVPEIIKLNDYLSFLSELTDKTKDYSAEIIEEPILNYFSEIVKDKYMSQEIRPVIKYLIKREMKMIKRDIFSQKNISREEYKKIILSYFSDGKFIDRLTTRYNIIYANRKDKDIYVNMD